MIAALLGLALAEIPAELRPAAAPEDAIEAFAKALPDQPPLACAVLLEGHARLCFRVWEGKSRRWVTGADLARWETDVAGLVAAVTASSAPRVDEAITRRSIADMDAHYVDLRDGDGWAVAPLLHGARLAERIDGERERVAIPRSGVFVAWPSGSAELDKVMAVAVREMYDGADDAVTPMVHVWTGEAFVPFGQANPTGG